MHGLRVFTDRRYGHLSVIVEDGEVFIEGTKLASKFGYTNPHKSIKNHCLEEGVTIRSVGVITGKRADGSDIIQYVNKKFINESNVYRLAIRSNLEKAREFQRWLFEEVLPSIRKHGTYMDENLIDEAIDNPKVVEELIHTLKNEREEKKVLEQQNIKLESDMKKMKVYSDFGKAVSMNEGAITVGEFAKLLNNLNIKIGRNTLYKWLREQGYLICKGKEKNRAKQVYVKQGIFQLEEIIEHTEEGKKLYTNTLITGKGQLYLTNKIIKSYLF